MRLDGLPQGVLKQSSILAGAAGTMHGPHRREGGCVLLTTFSEPLDFVLAD